MFSRPHTFFSHTIMALFAFFKIFFLPLQSVKLELIIRVPPQVKDESFKFLWFRKKSLKLFQRQFEQSNNGL